MEELTQEIEARSNAMDEVLEKMLVDFDSFGTTIFQGRNTVRLFCYGKNAMVVKRFGHNRLLHVLRYTARQTKAARAFHNGEELIRRGVLTPLPIAFIVSRGLLGLPVGSYVINSYVSSRPLSEIVGDEFGEFDRDAVHKFAVFVASLHAKGIEHEDLNSTNVRMDDAGNFLLIDVNRMKFYEGGVPMQVRFRNIARFCCNSPMFEFFLREYLNASGMPSGLFDQGIAAKMSHDARWHRQERRKDFFTRLFRFKKCHK